MCNYDIPGIIVSFADETALIFDGKTWRNTFDNCAIGLRRAKKWLNNILTLNSTKTKYWHLAYHRIHIVCKIVTAPLRKCWLYQTPSCKDWIINMEQPCWYVNKENQVSFAVNIFKELRHILDNNKLKNYLFCLSPITVFL